MNFKNLKKRIFTSIFLLFLVFLIFNYNIILVYTLIVIGTLSILEFINLSKRIFKINFYLYSLNLFFIFYILIFCLLFYYFLNIIFLKFFIMTFLLGCIASDVGGYFFGKIFKGPKLSQYSPNKTISGSTGSFILTSLVICGILSFLFNKFDFRMLGIALLTSFFCQFGDLFFSYLKRKAKLKDTSNFLPGHGGILDRIDGILFGLPVGFIALILMYS